MDEEHHNFLLYPTQTFHSRLLLATETEVKQPKAASIISENDITRIETQIDQIDAQLPRLNRFVLPAATKPLLVLIYAAPLPAEPSELFIAAEEFPVAENVVIFLNRLSDYFFVLARLESNKSSKEIFWEQGDI